MDEQEVIEYIKSNFDEYTIQGIAIELLDSLPKKPLSPLDQKRREFNKLNKRIILERDAYRCLKCGSYKNLHVDHIIPLSKGGTNDLSNLQTLCSKCNLEKSDNLNF